MSGRTWEIALVVAAYNAPVWGLAVCYLRSERAKEREAGAIDAATATAAAPPPKVSTSNRAASKVDRP